MQRSYERRSSQQPLHKKRKGTAPQVRIRFSEFVVSVFYSTEVVVKSACADAGF